MKVPVVVDIETDGLPFDGRLLCIGWQLTTEPFAHVEQTIPDHVRAMLADEERPKVTQSRYDARWLRLHGVEVRGAIYDTMVPAWLMNENTPLGLEYLVKRYVHAAMDKRIRQSGGVPLFKCDDGTEVPLGEAPWEQMQRYNTDDVEKTTELWLRLHERLDSTEWLDYWQREHQPFTNLLIDMECRGLPVDLEASEKLRLELEEASASLATTLMEVQGLPEAFNLNSGPQLSNLLFRKVFELTDSFELDEWEMGALKSCINEEHEDCNVREYRDDSHTDVWHVVDALPRGFSVDKLGRTLVHGRWTLKGFGLPAGFLTPSGDRPSTSSPALLCNLDAARHDWVKNLLRYRKMTKVLTTYLRKFPKVAHDGRVYGRFNQTGTVTGRLSSSDPNLQNIPAHGELGPKVRDLFRAAPGTLLLVGDYSQLEPRLMAHYSQDPVLLDVYRTGTDIYLRTAEGIWGERVEKEDERRGIAKTYVLAMGYGAGVKKLQQILTINGYPLPLREVEWQFGKLQDLYGHFFRWREAVIAKARRTGYVQTIAGQHRRLAAQFKSDTWKARGYGERQAVNAVIQGSAGDIVRRAMMEFDRHEPGLRLLAQVHDELVWEVDEGAVETEPWYLESVATRAEKGHGFELSVPLVFEPHVGRTWLEAKEGSAFLLPENFESPFEDAVAEVEE